MATPSRLVSEWVQCMAVCTLVQVRCGFMTCDRSACVQREKSGAA